MFVGLITGHAPIYICRLSCDALALLARKLRSRCNAQPVGTAREKIAFAEKISMSVESLVNEGKRGEHGRLIRSLLLPCIGHPKFYRIIFVYESCSSDAIAISELLAAPVDFSRTFSVAAVLPRIIHFYEHTTGSFRRFDAATRRLDVCMDPCGDLSAVSSGRSA